MKLLVSIFMIIGTGVCSADSDVDEFIAQLKHTTTNVLCDHDDFLRLIKKTNNECAMMVEVESRYCGSLVKVFVPTEEFDEEVKERIRNISMLHLSCIKSRVVERALLYPE